MSVSHDEVRHIAALAHIALADDRIPGLAHELSGILEHMAVLQRVATDVMPAADPDFPQTPWRGDHGPPILLHRPLEVFAPEVRDGFLIVPRLATHGGRAATEGTSSLSEGSAIAPADAQELP